MVSFLLFQKSTRSEIYSLGRYESINAYIRALTRAFDSDLLLDQLSHEPVDRLIWFLVS